MFRVCVGFRPILIASVAAVFVAAPASAATVVTGADTASGPLVIAPDSGPRDDTNFGKLFFIQKMPVTKTVNRVTLGDIALSTSCTATGPVLNLSVAEHPSGAMAGESVQTVWEGKALEPIAADHVFRQRTWRTQPMTLVKGRGYSFNVSGTQSGCTSFEVRSWAHNGPKVNPGSVRCDRVFTPAWRMWHDSGANDAVACGAYATLPEDFDSSMPPGWLSVYPYSYPYNFVEVLRGSGPVPPTNCRGQGYGARAVPWRPWPGYPGWTEYVCIWTQADSQFPDYVDPASPFYPNDPADGWYYGFGWSAMRPGGPRDMYLKLDLDEAELASWYKPNLRFDTSEKWRPLNLTQFFDERDSTTLPMHRRCQPPPAPPGSDPNDIDPWGGATEAAYCPRIGTPEELMGHNTSDTYIKVNGFDANSDDDYRSPNGACNLDGLYDCNGGLISTLYYFVSEPAFDSHYRYIGYWAFYRWNDFGEVGDHEGDWEGVAIAPSRQRPATFDYAAFSSHSDGWYSYLRDTLTCADNAWENPKTCGTEQAKEFSHVRTYVANGGHANYPKPCARSGTQICERATGIVPEESYDGTRDWGNNSSALGLHQNGLTAFPDPGSGSWVDWIGRWGSPAGPAQQDTFYDPWGGCGYGQSCLQPSSAGRRTDSTTARSARIPVPRDCRRWFGPLVGALACDGVALPRALSNGTLGRQGRLTLTVRRGSVGAAVARDRPAADSAPAITQLVAEPLGVGDELRIRGRAAAGTQLFVRYRTGTRVRVARLRDLGLERGGTAVVRMARRHGRLEPVIR